MVEEAQPIIQITTPNRLFEGHSGGVTAVAVFPDGRRMVTSSYDETLCSWDLRDGVVLKKIGCHSGVVRAVIVSGDGKSIASGYGSPSTKTEESQTIKRHSYVIRSLDFSPDGAMMATGSYDKTTKLWCTKTWDVYCVKGAICICTPLLSGELIWTGAPALLKA